jgi:hypothetical protein
MREQTPDGSAVALGTILLPENSIALDSLMSMTDQSEQDAVNQAIKLYAAIVSVSADPRDLDIGVIADPATARDASVFRRVIRRLNGHTTLVQWLRAELVRTDEEKNDRGDDD